MSDTFTSSFNEQTDESHGKPDSRQGASLQEHSGDAFIDRAFAAKHRCVPKGVVGETVVVGFEEPPPDQVIDDLVFLSGREIRVASAGKAEVDAFVSSEEEEAPLIADTSHLDPPIRSDAAQTGDLEETTSLRESTSQCEDASQGRVGQGHAASNSKGEVPCLAPAPGEGHVPLGNLRFEGPAPSQVRHIIGEAIARGVSDIHIEPYEAQCRVRYRLDGVLHEAGALDPARQSEVTARIKIMAELDIAERRRPQDGRITFASGHRGDAVDLRVSTLPTAFGEKIVLRVLDRSGIELDLGVLGFADREKALFEKTIGRPHGLVLVTGPTGSGKTTTLYAALNALRRPAVNIQTIEDPIEYELPGINQAQVKSDIGFTFAEALRAFLRQDPDIIMVGEIRDRETAEIAIRAALTGHLVLSTLHTNDAPGAAGRLLDMGVPPYLAASSLELVVAQRLVRRVCTGCAKRVSIDEAALGALGLESGTEGAVGEGCPVCNGTGFRGRTAVFEMMAVTEAIAALITEQKSTHVLRRTAQKEGMQSLRTAAAAKVAQGATTSEEAIRRTTL